ncbi:MAG: VCBS repeat-containing protein [Acidobacteria bacterium]|nr:VCBS repeat-containing protein [Acidobacteriota bacterium]
MKGSRRRRRVIWTLALLGVTALAGTAAGVWWRRAHRPEVYRPGEENPEITRTLARGLPPDAPKPRFTDVTVEAGLGEFRTFRGERTSQLPEDMGSGAAWGDFDNDGDDDLFLVSAGGPLNAPAAERAPSLLYENLGNGTFRRVESFPDTRILGMAAAWGDYNNDGWLDLVVTGSNTLLLFRNERGRFVRDERFPNLKGFWAGASWGDYDRDGYLDLYVCGYVRYTGGPARASEQYGRVVPFTLNPASYEPERNLLFHNNRDGTFTEVAEKMGVANPQGRSLSALWQDFDDDGWPDLYIANDISDNVLYRNRRGKFRDVSHASWVADYRGAMGLATGDWNRDGDDDLFISHWIAQQYALYDSLWQETKELHFMDVAEEKGIGQVSLQSIGWGAEFADFDGDGWLDLVVANGSTFETEGQPRRLIPQPSFLFWNRRGEYFYNLAPLSPALAAPHVSRGLALSDYDNDGDLDILIVDRDGGVRLLRNDMQRGNWLELRLRGRAENAKVIAWVGGVALRRTVTSASYLSQSTRTVHFGLGPATRMEKMEVRWPSGKTETYGALEANAIWEVAPGGSPRRAADKQRRVEFWTKQREAMNAMKIEGDLPRAMGLFQEALALDPSHEDARYYLANCLAAQGDVKAALAQFEELARINPQSQRAYRRLGVLRATTDLNAARKALEKALVINPEETGTLLVLGEVDLLQGKQAEALQRWEWACRTNPRAAGALFLRGYLAWKRGHGAEARELLVAARKALGDDWKPQGSVAEGDVRQKMYSEETVLSRFWERWNGSPEPAPAFGPLDSYLKRLSSASPAGR